MPKIQKEFLTLEIGLNSSTGYLGWLRRLVLAMNEVAGHPISRRSIWRCSVALTEAFTNAVVHAHKRDVSRIIGLRCVLRGGSICMRVRDSGGIFKAGSGLVPKPHKTRGRGLYLIRELTDHLRVRRVRGGNVLEFVIYEGEV